MSKLFRSRPLIATCIGLSVLIACLIDTQFAWLFNQARIERQIYQIGEIYLDGLVASIKAGAQNGSIGDVDRRLKSAFTEQSGIKELALMVFDSDGRMTNIAGRKTLAAEEVVNLEPGAFLLNLENKTLVVSRRFGDNKSRATAVLDIAFVMKNYNYAEVSTLWASALAAAAAALSSLLVLMAAAKVAKPEAGTEARSEEASVIA